MQRFFLTTILFSGMIYASGTMAQTEDIKKPRPQLQPRSEWNIRTGSERTTGMGELWIPLIQDPLEGRVLYGDFRFMDDNLDNQEYNVGLGYRTINDDIPLIGRGIVGVHGWVDRRYTDRGTHFNQVTLGTEVFTEALDAKVNVYTPLNKQKTHLDPNPNGSNPQFTGNVLTVNTDQVTVEEAMPGFDIELGARVPWMDDYTDSTRFYAGAYHFEGHRAENITGFRTRLSADITSNIQIGGRFQHDDVRGGQGFLEATFRLPFGNKQSYRKTGLYARLDESPERDIDIVSNEAITDAGYNKPLLNTTTGTTQNIIHVDNTAAGGGDGSNEARFNTLAAAEAAAGANDMIYVHRGDGTTTGQNVGITLAQSGMKLIGSGVDLTPDLMGLTLPSNARGLNAQTTIIAATTAPVITNTIGNGVTVNASQTKVSGLNIDGATSIGILIAQSTTDVIISNNTVQNTVQHGINRASSGNVTTSILNNTVINAGTAASGTQSGIFLTSNTNHSSTYTVSGNTVSNSYFRNIWIESVIDSNLTSYTRNNISTSGGSAGITIASQGSSSHNATVENNTVTATTTTSGIIAGGVAVAGNLSNFSGVFRSNTVTGASTGIDLSIQDQSSASFQLDSNVMHSNVLGLHVRDNSSGSITGDIGGGSLGSTGNNQLFSNTNKDIRIDLDGGELKAENNWWGNVLGLLPAQVTLDVGSTIDADPFLTSAP